ncbi:MAG: hypothetical protein Q9161_000479 [Pseudevernia consocians]
MSSTHKPAVLLVHGGFHLPETYAPFLDKLSNAGFAVRCPHLPTNGDTRPPKATFQDDVTAVRGVASDLASTGHQVIILAHSYGGLVASEAITEDLYAKHGNAGVVRLIYLSAWLVPRGTSLTQLLERSKYQAGVVLEMNEDGMALPTNGPEAFYHDVESERAEELSKKLVTHNFLELSTIITNTPWMDLPTLFVYCAKDVALSLDLQKSIVSGAVESGAMGLSVRTLESSHGPFWSMPAAVVGVVEDVWKMYIEG